MHDIALKNLFLSTYEDATLLKNIIKQFIYKIQLYVFLLFVGLQKISAGLAKVCTSTVQSI